MPRYVDADALGIGYANPKVFNSEEYARGWNSAIEIINSAPTISPDEVRGVGEWITTRTWEHDGDPYCSICGFENCYTTDSKDFKFCPNCGAKMEVSEDA